MKFLPDVGTHKEAQNQNVDATGSVCKLQTKILKIRFLEIQPRHANLKKLSRIVTIDVRNGP